MQKFIEEINSDNKNDFPFFESPDSFDDSIKDNYVYAWFTKTNPKKYFYIGKGKKDRYKHILWDINAVERDKRKYKGKRYKLLNDILGIDYEFLYKNVTAKEAAVLELYCIVKYLKSRQPLLNQIRPDVDDATNLFWEKVNYSNDEELLEYFK